MGTIDATERELIAICLTQRGAFREVAVMIQNPKIFSIEHGPKIFTAMQQLHSRNLNTDLVSVSNELTRLYGETNTDHGTWLNLLTPFIRAANRFTGNISYKCEILLQNALIEDVLHTSTWAINEAQIQGTNPHELIDAMIKRLSDAKKRLSIDTDITYSDYLNEAVTLAEQAAKTGDPITGIKTLFGELDLYLKGLQPSTLTIMAGRPGMGKTAEVCQIAYNTAFKQGIPTALFSLEMNGVQMARRTLAIDTQYKNGEVMSGCDRHGNPISILSLRSSAERLGKAPIFLFDKIRTLPQFRAKVTQLVDEAGLKLVIVDYLQLMRTGGKNDSDGYSRVSEVSRELKELSIIHNIPIIALAQLSRSVETRGGDKRPMLSDLKESGSIEQDADNVIFLYRPSYYGITAAADGSPLSENDLFNIVAKNRNGSTHTQEGGILLHYTPANNRIRSTDSPTPTEF
ncbi:replicative DNA helicase [Larkinella ripae]